MFRFVNVKILATIPTQGSYSPPIPCRVDHNPYKFIRLHSIIILKAASFCAFVENFEIRKYIYNVYNVCVIRT